MPSATRRTLLRAKSERARDVSARQSKKVQQAKRYAEDPVHRQKKKAYMAKRYAEDPVREAGMQTLHSGKEANWRAVAALYVTPAGHCFHHAGGKHAVNPRARRLVACSLVEAQPNLLCVCVAPTPVADSTVAMPTHEHVARVLWRRRFRCAPPVDMGPFGGAGVLLMGDFAQLPPVLRTSLMASMPAIGWR